MFKWLYYREERRILYTRIKKVIHYINRIIDKNQMCSQALCAHLCTQEAKKEGLL